MENTKLKWVLLAFGVYVNGFLFAMLFAFGSFLNAMLDKFQENVSTTATVQAIFIGVGLSAGILSGALISRFGKWRVALVGGILCPLGFILSFLATSVIHLYISIGVMSGLGVSLMFISITTVIGKTFLGTQKFLALSIQNAAVSVGVAIIPYITDFLLEAYGLNGTFLLVGGFYLNLIPGTRLLAFVDQSTASNSGEPTKPNTTTQRNIAYTNSSTIITNDRVSELNNLERSSAEHDNCIGRFGEEIVQLRTNFAKVLSVRFMLFAMGVGIIMGSLNGAFALITNILTWKGFTQAQTLVAFPITYGIGFLARLLPGLMEQLKGVNSFLLPIVFSMCGCAGQLIICYAVQHAVILFGCALFGFAISGVVSSANILVVLMLDQELIATGFGLVYTGIGVTSAVFGPVYGAIRDSSKTYVLVLYLTAGFQLAGMFLFITTMLIRAKRSRTRTYDLSGTDNEAHSLEIKAR